MKREVQDGPRTDARYVAEIHLPTGKVLSIESEWMPSHCDLVDLRRGVIDKARRRARGIRREVGVSADVIKVHCEQRTIVRVVETTERRTLDSEHFLESEGKA